MRVLSTKKLLPNQKELLLNTGLSYLEYDAIKTIPIDFELPSKLQNLIITSQNAADAFLKKVRNAETRIAQKTNQIQLFCVGPKTALILSQAGFTVLKTAKNSVELGQFIISNYSQKAFVFFCGAQRRDELPDLLATHNIPLREIKVYKTISNPQYFSQVFQAILFFSPSGVKAFASVNDFRDALVVCIGETTATSARNYSNKVVVANSTTVESVIAKTAKILIH